MTADPYHWWREALAGNNPPIHEIEPQCGYFKIRDRRGLNKKLAPIKRKFVAAAIWKNADGELQAEMAKSAVNMERAWPWFARFPITHEEYAYWHKHERWPQEAMA